MGSSKLFVTMALAGSLTAILALPVAAQQMTGETRKILAALKLGPDILKGLDQELKVPQAWIDGAKKEGVLKVRTTINPRLFPRLEKVFNARYPFVKIEYTRGVGRNRAIVPLMALKQGKYVSDVVTSIIAVLGEFKKIDGLVDLHELPGFKNVAGKYRSEDGTTVGVQLHFWCISYNTNRVKKEELPKTWEQLITDPRWRNGKAGIGQRPHLWLTQLWGVFGDKWYDDYTSRLFSNMRPQLRKESMSALPKLVSLGEMDIAIPSSSSLTKSLAKTGVPVGFHCPEPIPVNYTAMSILKGNPHINSAKLFVNWLLSKEGQIASNVYAQTVPTHKDLQQGVFMTFPETIKGKKWALRDAKVQGQLGRLIGKFSKMWIKAGGPKPRRRGKPKKR